MRISFWPDRAWSSLVGPAWPWFVPTDPRAFSARIQQALDPYWEQRLALVPSSLLTDRAKDLLRQARATITGATLGGAGFEKVALAMDGESEAFWFFELGSPAWVLCLRRLRSEGWLPPEPEEVDLAAIEQLWQQAGPAQAAAEIDRLLGDDPLRHPALSLYRVPLAIWHDRNPQAGMRHLDRAMGKLSSYATAAMGVALPLTYGLLHALNGDLTQAVKVLTEGRVPGRPTGWQGMSTPEARYHRARYLWDLHQQDDALALLKQVVAVDATYALRLATDPAWMHAGVHNAQGLTMGVVGDLIGRARTNLARFQQSRGPVDADAPEVRRIVETIEFAGDEAYMVLAAATRLPAIEAWRRAQASVGPGFYANVDRLQQFASGLPMQMPLRLGPQFRSHFHGTPDSDMALLIELLDGSRFSDAAHLVTRYLDEVPYAVRMATVNYAQRLVNALATAAEVLRLRGKDSDRDRYLAIIGLSERCLKLVEPIKALPDDVGNPLAYQLHQVWEEMLDIERAWVKLEARMFGQLRLEPPALLRPVRRGSWIAYACKVTDAAGQPVAGVPVVWRVASGPGLPKEPTECLANEWGLSLQTGVVYLPIAAQGSGAGGEIEATILGNHSPLRIAYQVSDTAAAGDDASGVPAA